MLYTVHSVFTKTENRKRQQFKTIEYQNAGSKVLFLCLTNNV